MIVTVELCQNALEQFTFLGFVECVEGVEVEGLGFAAVGGNAGSQQHASSAPGQYAPGVVAETGNEAELRVACAPGAPPAEQPVGDVKKVVRAYHRREDFFFGVHGGGDELLEAGFRFPLAAAYLVGAAVAVGVFLLFVQVAAFDQQYLERGCSLGGAGVGPVGHFAQQSRAAFEVGRDFKGGIGLVEGRTGHGQAESFGHDVHGG